jgi:hypothetical protein
MTKEEMTAKLKSYGLTKRFKPLWDNESETILLQTKKQVTINEGVMHGCEIAIHPYGAQVWTHKKKLANRIKLANNGITIRLLDNEAELMIPLNLCDALLPLLGAKVKSNRKGNANALMNWHNKNK